MQMRNGSIMAKVFQIILVFSSRGLFKNEDEIFFQQVFSLFRSLNMIEFKTIFMANEGKEVKNVESIMKRT